MSFKAHECFCYSPHYAAIGEFLRDIGSNPKQAGLNPVSDPIQLRGLRHVSFFNAVSHMIKLPQEFVQVLMEIGAQVVAIDDSYEKIHVHEPEHLLS